MNHLNYLGDFCLQFEYSMLRYKSGKYINEMGRIMCVSSMWMNMK